jgi:hypothetical protein
MKQTKVAEGIIAEDGGALLRKRIVELEWDKEALQLAVAYSAEDYEMVAVGY